MSLGVGVVVIEICEADRIRNLMSIPRTSLEYPEWTKEGLAEM